MMSKVSVIIPVYKVEKYLRDCLDSVLSQTMKDMEIICIDDASPDHCPQILDEYAEKDRRMKVLHFSKNHHQGYGRNRGLEMAGGKYVYFLDSDDMIKPDAMEVLYQAAERDDLDGIFFDSEVLFENEGLKKKHGGYQTAYLGKYEDRVYSGRELYRLFIEQRDWNCYVQRQFWRREMLIENGIFNLEGTEHEDEGFSFKAILSAQRCRYIREAFFIRRYRPDSVMTRKPGPKDFHGYFRHYCDMLNWTRERGLEGRDIDHNILHMYFYMETLFSAFRETEEPEDWFQDQTELTHYYFFAMSQNMEDYYKEETDLLCSRIPPESSIWIYGAGTVGKRVYKMLEKKGVYIKGFLVTDRKNNPDILFGRRVIECRQYVPGENDLVILAAAAAYRQEMKAMISKMNIKHIEYQVRR